MHEATLPLLLKQLGLTTFYQHWEPLSADAIEKGWSHSQYLKNLAEKEVAVRKQRRIQRHIKEAKLPPGKTLDSFDFKTAPSVNKQMVDALANSTLWVKDAQNLILFGPSGVGKSHLAAAITYRLIEQGIRALYYSATKLVQELQQAKQSLTLTDKLAKLARVPLLVIDDIGYVKKDETESSVLFELIADRYEAHSLIITANQPFSEWDSIFPNNTMTIAAVDRIVHHSTIININEKSYRAAHRKLNMIGGEVSENASKKI